LHHSEIHKTRFVTFRECEHALTVENY